MRVFVKAKAGAREEKIVPPAAKLWQEKESGNGVPAPDEWFVISIKEPPVQGRANDAIIKALAKHFNVSNSQVRLISGASSKRKVFEIR